MRCRSADNLNATTRTRMRRANRSTGPITPATGSGRFGRRADRCRAARRRGAVLIMVVAVLGILFVSGVALLTVVTFASRSLDAAKAERENRDAVDAIERMVAMKLADGFLNIEVSDPGFPNGVPLSMSTPLVMHQPGIPGEPCVAGSDCVLAMPTSGEVPGIHLVDVTEPIENARGGGNCEFQLISNLKAALAGKSPNSPMTAAQTTYITSRLAISVNKPGAAQSAFGFDTGASPLVLDPDSSKPVEWQPYNDADGDGVLDAVEMTLPTNLLPPDLRRSLANRLRADNSATDPDELTITLRVIDHGGLVDLNNSHAYMKRMALGYSPASIMTGEPTNAELFAGAPYQPESNEWMLRSRGMLTPLSVQPTRLMATLGSELLCSEATSRFQNQLCSPGFDLALLADPTARNWWGYDPVADTADIDSPWRTQMNPANLGNPDSASPSARRYDVSHNLTTVSHDDLLMRSFVDPATNKDAITTIKELDNNANGRVVYNIADKFALDNYPLYLDGTGDPRLGRLKISLPYLDGMKILSDADRVARTLQDAFLLMLRNRRDFTGNRDSNGDGDVSDPEDQLARWVQAAMLAANMMDYIDNDDEPFAVPVIDTNGLPVEGTDKQLVAYGFEQQPFITEIVVKGTGSQFVLNAIEESTAVIAIELYNPYSRDIDLSAYELTDLATGNTSMLNEITGAAFERLDNEPLPPLVIPGGVPSALALDHESRFVTICSNYGPSCPEDGNASGGRKLSGVDFGIDDDSIIALVRPITRNAIVERVVVDKMEFDSADATIVRPDPGAGVGDTDPKLDPPPAPLDTVTISVQRDTTAGFWRFPVPKTTRFWTAGDQSPGQTNEANIDSVLPDVYPVHLELVNSGSFTGAFPTTGSMLLLSRMAHIYDPVANPTDPPGPLSSPFNRVSANLLGTTPAPENRDRNILGQFDQIDNGRLPVFDVRPDLAATPRERTVPAFVAGQVEGLDTLPWGQLIFDYFTAIPIQVCAGNNIADPTCLPGYQDRLANLPPVDQAGMRVHGRINLNTASLSVLSSLPMIDGSLLPPPYRDDLQTALSFGRATLGENLARAIIAYREARDHWSVGMMSYIGDYEQDRSPYVGGNSGTYRPRLGYGFLTVGELLNVRDPNAAGFPFDETNPVVANMRMDAYAASANASDVLPVSLRPAASFEHAVAHMVALDEWVTTRSHVFTIYGVIRGAHQPLPDPSDADYDRKLASFQRANQRAIRFQSTVDRLPMVFGAKRPVRIGSRITGGYADVRSD